jgi:hypothetical protein
MLLEILFMFKFMFTFRFRFMFMLMVGLMLILMLMFMHLLRVLFILMLMLIFMTFFEPTIGRKEYSRNWHTTKRKSLEGANQWWAAIMENLSVKAMR